MFGKLYYHIRYEGNGATGWSKDKINGKKEPCGTGSLRFCVLDKSVRKPYRLQPCFEQKSAQFEGYSLRRKKGKQWQWHCNDGKWHGLKDIVTREELEQTRIRPEEEFSFSKFGIARGTTVVADARWRHVDTKEEMNCGFYIYRNRLMCHALGVSESGKTYQNTEAVFEQSYKKGYRYYEVDVAVTEDDKMVCCHGWSEKNCRVCGMEYRPEFEHMTYDLFMQQNVDGNPVMDVSGLKAMMEQYPDTFFEIDLHKGNTRRKIELLVEAMEEKTELLDRLLLQAQGRPAFKEIDETHKFLNVQIIAGQEWLKKMEEMIAFALEHGVCAIALRKDLALEQQVQMIRAAGLYVLAYTIPEDAELSAELLGRGVSTICTDKVTYDALEMIEKTDKK